MSLAVPLLMLADCANCTLCGEDEAPRAVLGSGSRSARLVVVGEAPGAVEVARGEPFLGPSGKLLWETLGRWRIKREEVYATNALLCLPPIGKTISPKTLRACSPRLVGELKRLPDKRVILCVGSKAAEAVRGRKGSMGDLSGRSEWSEEYGCWLTFAYHPAAVLRRPELYEDFAWGVKCAIEQLDAPEGPAEQPELRYQVIDNTLRAVAVLEHMRRAEPHKIVCDLETTGLDPQNDRILEIGFRDEDAGCPIILPADFLSEPSVCELLERLYAASDITWIYHNGKFDVQFLRKAGFRAMIGADTMLMHHALDERSGGEGGGFHDLKRCARKYLHVPPWEDEAHDQMKEAGGMEAVDPEIRRKYQAYDLEYTWRLYGALRTELNREPPSRAGFVHPLETVERLVIPAANALANIESRGVQIDVGKLIQLRQEYVGRIENSAVRCAELAGSALDGWKTVFNPNSTQQVQKVLRIMDYPFMGSSDEQTIHALQRWDREHGRPVNPFLDEVLEYRSLLHTKSTYLDGIAKRLIRHRDGRLRGSFLLHGTTSGRLAARDPNLQNIPADSVIKELFIAPPGYVLVNADFAQLEVRVLFWYSRDQALRASLLSGDFHWDVAQRVFPQQAKLLTAAKGDLTKLEQLCQLYTMWHDFWKRQQSSERTEDHKELFGWMFKRIRRQAKYVTFGTMYGEGAEALADPEKGMGVPVPEAQAALNGWYSAYATAREWLLEQVRLANSQRWVESYSGRRRRFPYPPSMGTHIANEAMNHPIQAMASDIDLLALVRLEEELPAKDLGAPLIPVHDSILFQVRESRVEEAMALIRERMTEVVVDPEMVFDIDMKAGTTWAQCA